MSTQPLSTRPTAHLSAGLQDVRERPPSRPGELRSTGFGTTAFDGLAVPDGCNDAAGNTDQCGNDNREQRQEKGRFRPLGQRLRHWPL